MVELPIVLWPLPCWPFISFVVLKFKYCNLTSTTIHADRKEELKGELCYCDNTDTSLTCGACQRTTQFSLFVSLGEKLSLLLVYHLKQYLLKVQMLAPKSYFVVCCGLLDSSQD